MGPMADPPGHVAPRRRCTSGSSYQSCQESYQLCLLLAGGIGHTRHMVHGKSQPGQFGANAKERIQTRVVERPAIELCRKEHSMDPKTAIVSQTR
jgi:hypothetical protein